MTKQLLQISFMLLLFSGLVACATGGESNDSQEIEELASEDASGDAATDESTKEEFNEDFEDEPAVEENANNEVVAESQAEEPAVEEPQSETSAPEPQTTQVENVPANRVTAINYLASANGGTIEIKTSVQAAYNVRPNPDKNQYVVEIKNAVLAEALTRPFIMKDFEGAFGTVNAYQNPGGNIARIVIQMKGDLGEPVFTQEGNSLLVIPPGASATPTTLSAAPAPEPEGSALSESGGITAASEQNAVTDSDSYDTQKASESEKTLAARTLDEFLTGSGKFFGRPISIETNSADIRDVIKFIAEESGVNLVISDDVEGKVTLKLRQVPWDQALVIVMLSKGLGYIRQGNVLRVTKLMTLQAEAMAAKEIVESQKKLTPLKVKVMPVSYAAVADLEKQIKPFLSENRGQIVSDARTSSLIITDTADVLMRVERLVKELDIPPAQVMIEGKIVEATENFSRSVGVNWSLSGAPFDLSDNGGLNGSAIRSRFGLGSTSVTQSQQSAQNGFFNLQIGTLDFLGSLDSSLSLAQADNLVKIISSPRIVTMNKEPAMISQKGEVITLQSTTDVGNNRTTTANRTPIELKLDVTPQITAEGSVVLEVKVLRQFAGAQADSDTKARPINTREAKTKVLVPSGQTAVIGGIYQSDETVSENGVPGLKDIPVLGWLFKQKSQDKIKTELLLFLTPRVLNAKEQAVTN